MIVGIYSVKDTVANEFGPLFQAKNDAVATRYFDGFLKDDKVNPADYRLYQLGLFDTENGFCSTTNTVVPLDHFGEVEA